MKYAVKETAQFRRDRRRAIRRGLPQEELDAAVVLLASGASLPPEYRDHALAGRYAGLRECHIRPDWLLVYAIIEDVLVLSLARTGTHSDLFGR